jgi:hypothetical protein
MKLLTKARAQEGSRASEKKNIMMKSRFMHNTGTAEADNNEMLSDSRLNSNGLSL